MLFLFFFDKHCVFFALNQFLVLCYADPNEVEPTQCKSATGKHPSEASLLHPSGHEKTGVVGYPSIRPGHNLTH